MRSARVASSIAAESRVLPVRNERTGMMAIRRSLLTRARPDQGIGRRSSTSAAKRPRSGMSCMTASVIRHADAERFDGHARSASTASMTKPSTKPL